MTKNATPDEQPKARIARRVVTAKRMYFVPEYGVSVEADSAEAAVKKARTATEQSSGEQTKSEEEEVGDA